ncbi:MAG: helix-turn-helix domain-containing protein [Gammaproteobacteria bacterium]|nr:helix-turn-helix domain-containing protein [Gammaproteobacteria bacterium]
MEQVFFLNQNLNDFDSFCENVRNWDLRYQQLDNGKFSSELLVFGNSEIQFTHARLSRKMLQQGSSPHGLITFGILANPQISIHWRNMDISGDMLFVFPEGGELNSISQSDFNVYVLSLTEGKLNASCDLLDLPDIRTLINKNEAFKCRPEKIDEFRRWLHTIKIELTSLNTSVRDKHYLNHIEQEIIGRILSILTDNHLVTKSRSRKRDIAISIAENYISDSTSGVVTIPELCDVANISERTLEYAFRERYGMTPKMFTLVYRLNMVRKQLRKTEPRAALVSEIARQYGFWHMSQFTADYQRQFGELPSETLKKMEVVA